MGYIIKYLSTHTLVLCFIIGSFIIAYYWLKFQKELNMKWYIAPILSLSHCTLGVITMKLWAILEVGGNLEDAANMRIYGALFILTPLYYLGAKLTKRKASLVMDISSVCTIIGLFVGRINCLMSNCCAGTLITPGGSMHWPIREAELVYSVVFALYFGIRIYRKKTWGQVCPILFISYGTLRFILEWFREEFTTQVGIFHLAHIWSLLSIAIGAGCYIYINSKRKQNKKSGKNGRKPLIKETLEEVNK